MGRTESWPHRLEASPGWQAQTFHESEMALFYECMQLCARKVIDTADIVRDGDFRQLGPLTGSRASIIIERCAAHHRLMFAKSCLCGQQTGGQIHNETCGPLTQNRLDSQFAWGHTHLP